MKQTESTLHNWHFGFKQAGLAKSDEMDSISEQCKLFRAPTIIFSQNQFVATEQNNNIKLTFNAKEALRFINYEHRQQNFNAVEDKGAVNTISYIPPKLYVKHAEHWKSITKPKNIELTQLAQVSDSFFLSSFKGHIQGNVKIQKVKDNVIPVQKLGPNNPINFYQQGSFYQDQLDDNGHIQYQYKFRTMASSWFALIRMYGRIDSVAIVIYDTRLYWEQGWNMIARQFMVKSTTWDQIKDKEGELPPGWRMNPNQSHIVYPFVKDQFVQNEYIHYG